MRNELHAAWPSEARKQSGLERGARSLSLDYTVGS
ncbi:hypothetical protein AB7M17_006034 [Bradyrhizobium sp. USDA 377]